MTAPGVPAGEWHIYGISLDRIRVDAPDGRYGIFHQDGSLDIAAYGRNPSDMGFATLLWSDIPPAPLDAHEQSLATRAIKDAWHEIAAQNYTGTDWVNKA